jgi:DDE superfamily endonuclease/DDE family transposase
MDTTALATLTRFRDDIYRALGLRKDSLFELLEAALAAPGPATLARLSLPTVFRRGWASAPDALADGSLDGERCRTLVRRTLAEQPLAGRPVWALDGTVWPRPAAATSPERTWGHRPLPGIPQQGVVPAWEYEWLVAVPEPGSSWVLPLDVRRRGPGAGTPTELAITALRAALAARPAEAPRPVVALDSGYEPVQLARARLAADLLVRLRSNRVFCGPPPPYAGRGAPHKYGALFKLADPRTHPAAERSASLATPRYGQVRVDVWQEMRARGAADAPFTLVRVQLERLPRRAKPPAPLWLAWIGGDLPADLLDLWRWYCGRFTIEHGFRFLKQALGWTTVRPRDPAAADRWSWLLALALWQLWLARPLVADQRLPWEPPLPAERLTPGRVRRACPGLLAQLGTPARPPQPRGKSPGRRRGHCPGPCTRYPVSRRRPRRAA